MIADRIPTMVDRAFVQALAEKLVDEAEKLGVAITIERRPETPLAMGNHTPEITVWRHRREVA